MTGEERRQQLSEVLARRGFADLAALAAELNVSESTVRRDLTQLEEEGVARRTHGGAVFVSDRFSALNYSAREMTAVAEKQAVGRVVAGLIEDGETILLDGGTTTFQVAKNLLNRTLQVVTNSLPIANVLSCASNIELTLVGGYIYPRTGVALGPIALQTLASLHASKAIISTAGITEDGLFNANLLMVESEQRMMDAADEVIVVADSGKFGKKALAKICGLDRVNRVIVDDKLSVEWQNRLGQAGVELMLASTAEATVGGGG
ncbi:MAG TPA: DeoR/GlpR family DNA-binding transcription regulator [Phycisphaerae bacterium]|nr:DeoR/GlpR family DNA-binding transcription regulator [Phycisphaerae bacterium]